MENSAVEKTDLRTYLDRFKVKKRARGRPFGSEDGERNGFKYGFGSRFQLQQTHLRCEANARSGRRCEKPACKVNLAFGVRRCHFHSGPHDPWRIEYRLRRARGEFAGSGWERKRRFPIRHVTQANVEELVRARDDAMRGMERDRREMHRRLFRSCLDWSGGLLEASGGRSKVAMELLMQVTLADCLTGRRGYRSAQDAIEQAVEAAGLVVTQPATSECPSERRSERDRHNDKVRCKWRRKARLEALGLPDDTVPVNGS